MASIFYPSEGFKTPSDIFGCKKLTGVESFIVEDYSTSNDTQQILD